MRAHSNADSTVAICRRCTDLLNGTRLPRPVYRRERLVGLLYVALLAHTFGSVGATWTALRGDSAPAVATTLVDAAGLAVALLLYALTSRPPHAALVLLAAPLIGPGAAGAALLAQRESRRHFDASDAQRGAAMGAEVELL